jgi:hypothetical protein
MQLNEDAYRSILFGVSGKYSCTDMTIPQLKQALGVLENVGFVMSKKVKRVSEEEKGFASYAQLDYIKGMWQKCARNKSENAMLAFINRIAGVKTLRFLTGGTATKVILALRDMMLKAGYDPNTSSVREIAHTSIEQQTKFADDTSENLAAP